MSKASVTSGESLPGLEKYLTGDFDFVEQEQIIPSSILDLGDIAIKARTKTSLYLLRSAGVEIVDNTEGHNSTPTITLCTFRVARFSEMHYTDGVRFVQAHEFGERRAVVPGIEVGSCLNMTINGRWHRTTPVQSLHMAVLGPDR